MIWYDMIWYDVILWYDMIWCDTMIWYDMVWYDMVWYDMIYYTKIYNTMIYYDNLWYTMMVHKKERGFFINHEPHVLFKQENRPNLRGNRYSKFDTGLSLFHSFSTVCEIYRNWVTFSKMDRCHVNLKERWPTNGGAP